MMKQWLPFLLLLFLVASCNNKKDEKRDTPKTDTTSTTVIKENKEAATPTTGQSITGRWKPVEFMIKDMSEDEKKAMIANVILEFTGEGVFYAFNKEQRQEGTYTYKDNILGITNQGSSKTDRFTIGWDGSDMLMVNEEGTVKLARQ